MCQFLLQLMIIFQKSGLCIAYLRWRLCTGSYQTTETLSFYNLIFDRRLHTINSEELYFTKLKNDIFFFLKTDAFPFTAM